MIRRISQVAAFEISNTEDFSRDLDAEPKLHLYEQQFNSTTRFDKLFIQGDASQTSTKRKYSYAPFWSNTLLGTSNFFPEQSSLNITDQHTNSELSVLLNKVALPTLEYKMAYLYFSQGFLSADNIIGNAIRVFVRLGDSTEVTLASIADFKNDSLVTAVPAKLFENQIFNEALKFEIPDLDFILNSNNVDIVDLRNKVFGNERPINIHIEYSAFTNDEEDVFIDNSLNFTRLNFAQINQLTIDTSFTNESLYAKLSLGANNAVLQSSVSHTKYLVEEYLNTLKESGASYKVEHYYNVNVFNNLDELIDNKQTILRNPISKFETVQYRPVVSVEADHMTVEVTIRVENENTGMVIRRSTTIVVTSADIAKFNTSDTFVLQDLRVDEVTNQSIKEVKKIVQSAEVPKFVNITNNIYVQVQDAEDELELLDAQFTTKLNLKIDTSSMSILFLKIDNLNIKNELQDVTTFTIPAVAYKTKSKKYLILDSNGSVITQGKLIK